MIENRRKTDTNQQVWKYIREVNSLSDESAEMTALIDGEKRFTYRAMFDEWHRYAAVFTALGMTDADRSRVGIFGSTCSGVVFSIYGLNMTGAGVSIVPAYSAFTPSRVLQTIREENLTDLIVTDDFVQPNLLYELFINKQELGLKHIIVLHVPAEGVTVNRMLTLMQEMRRNDFKGWAGLLRMDELLKTYGGCSVKYSKAANNEAAFILHTSGTTKGTGKPVALSDSAFNAAVSSFYGMKDLPLQEGALITAAIVDLSNAYGMIDQIHLPLAMGATVVLVPGGILNPNFHKAIPHYGITFLFAVSAMFNRWMKLPEKKVPDFSSLRFVVFGGAAVSASDKRRFYEFIKAHGGGDIQLRNGYGISELGGACCLSSADIDDEAIGLPLQGVGLRLYDEEKGVYYSEKDAPCEGVLYLNAPSMASAVLDGREVFKTETIDGVPFICTNDLAGLDKNGRLTFLGRANRFFLNDDGVRYDAGRVETEVARQADIESCCIVPVYIKTTHDNIPMLCVKTLEKAGAGTGSKVSEDGLDRSKDIIRRALRTVFISEKTLTIENLPRRVKIVKEFPRNGNGKIDLYKVNRGEVEGDTFTVSAVRIGGEPKDIRLSPYTARSEDMIQEVFDGISAEIKNNLPGNRAFYKTAYQEDNMKDFSKMYDEFNKMNEQGKKMMTDMMGFAKMPMADCMKGAPNMGAMNKMMFEQMGQMVAGMQQMNKTALDMMQQMFEQNCKMTGQFFDMMQKMNSHMGMGGAAQAPEAPAKEEAEEAPKKKAAAKTTKAKE